MINEKNMKEMEKKFCDSFLGGRKLENLSQEEVYQTTLMLKNLHNRASSETFKRMNEQTKKSKFNAGEQKSKFYTSEEEIQTFARFKTERELSTDEWINKLEDWQLRSAHSSGCKTLEDYKKLKEKGGNALTDRGGGYGESSFSRHGGIPG